MAWKRAETSPRVSRKTRPSSSLWSERRSHTWPPREAAGGTEEGAQMGRPTGPAGRLQHNQAGTQTWTGLKASSRRVRAACDPNELPRPPRTA